MIDAILFDLDDTLSRHIARPDWDAVTALQVAALAPHCGRLGFGYLDLDAVVRRFWVGFTARYPDPDHDPDAPMEERRWSEGPAALRATLAEFGTECAADDAIGLWESLNSVPWRARHLHLYPDAVFTIRALGAAGYRLGVVTARALSAAVVADELREQGMPTAPFEVIATSGEVGYRKPHPSVFASAARRLDVPTERILMVGDSYESDIIPAADLGMIPVLKLNERAPDPRCVLAREQIRSLAELLDLNLVRRR